MSFFDPEQEDKLKEECGVFGIYNPDGSAAAPSIYYGLSALQHRGQEACGIAVCKIASSTQEVWVLSRAISQAMTSESVVERKIAPPS